MTRVGLSIGQAEHVISGAAEDAPVGNAYPGWAEDEIHEVPDETSAERADATEAQLRAMLR